MERDREEWRRPWRAEDTPERTVGPASDAPRPDAERPAPGADDPAPGAGPGAFAGGAFAGATVAGAARVAEADDPIARHPQPPPSGWGEGHNGPGSPAGSVRPPDTTGTATAPERAPRGRGLLAVVTAALVGALVATGVTLALTQAAGPTPTTSAPIEIEGDQTEVVPAVAQAVTPAVVSIDVLGGEAGLGGLPMGGQRSGLGSGVIYRSDGYILTNHHVIDGADTLRVRLSSGDILDAEVVGSDPLNDLAVVRVGAEELPTISIRPEDEAVRVGETVIAIGSPFGLEGSVTSGIVSALNRDIQVGEEGGAALTIPSVIQTDAAINPGNSGGALVDGRGRLIGINTAILTGSGANQGVGFAVPAEQAISSAEQLIEQGFVRHPLLGVTGIDVTPEVADEFGLDASRGAVVDSVQEGSGADDAGLQSGDIIVAVDGDELATMAELVALVRVREPGDILELTVVRDGEQLDVEVTLGERPR